MESAVPTLVDKARWNAIAVVAGSVGRLLAGIIVARRLGPELNGQFAFLLWVAETAVLFFNIGLPSALIRYLALTIGQGNAGKASRLMRWCLFAYLALGGMAATLMYLIAGHVLHKTGMPVSNLAMPLALLVTVQLGAGLTQAFLTGLQEFRAYAKVVLISSLALLFGQGIGAFWWGLKGTIFGTVASYAVAAALYLSVAIHKRALQAYEPVGNKLIDRDFIRYSMDSWLAALISSISWGRTELFFIERYAHYREAGYFSVGLVFSSLIVQAVSLVSGALLPHLSYLVGADQMARLQSDYRRLTTAIAIFAFPVSLGGIALMPEMMRLVFGQAYAGAVPTARWLMATGLLSFATVGSSVIYSLGDARIIRNWSVLGACLLVLGCISLVPAYGAAGAAATRFIVQMVLVAIGTYLLRFRYRQPFPAKALARTLVAAICCGLIALAIVNAAGGGAMVLALGVICGALVYAALLRAFRVISPEDADTLRSLTSRLPAAGFVPFKKILNVLIAR